jgi:hypothetical protein
MKNRIEQKNANQQRSEFSEFQKHGQLSLPPRTNPETNPETNPGSR